MLVVTVIVIAVTSTMLIDKNNNKIYRNNMIFVVTVYFCLICALCISVEKDLRNLCKMTKADFGKM